MTDRAAYTDPRWDPGNGGLPAPHNALLGVLNCPCVTCIRERASHVAPPRTHLEDLADELRARTEPDGRQSWPSAYTGSVQDDRGRVIEPAPSTIDPPTHVLIERRLLEQLAEALEGSALILRRALEQAS